MEKERGICFFPISILFLSFPCVLKRVHTFSVHFKVLFTLSRLLSFIYFLHVIFSFLFICLFFCSRFETQLHSLERAAAGIGLHVNVYKTEYMCFNQTGNISTQNGSSLKLVDKFTYQRSSVSSTETDINTRLAKAWTAIHRLLVMWKSDLTDKMKRRFFSSSSRVDTAVWMHYMDAN